MRARLGTYFSGAFRRAEALTDRDLMLITGAFLWAFSGVATAVAGVAAPELVPDPVPAWRLGCVVLVGAVTVSICTWVRKLDDKRLMQVIPALCALSVLLHAALMLGQPYNIAALYVGLISPALFAACFLPPRGAAFQVALLTLCAVVPAAIGYSAVPDEFVLSRVVAYMPILWVIAASIVLMQKERHRALRALDAVANTDPLTGVANLRKFEQHADKLLDPRNARIASPTGLLLIDLDDFKSINTNFGHAGGDLALQKVGSALTGAALPGHLVARIGGDEFAVLIEHADEMGLEQLAAHYQLAVAGTDTADGLGGRAISATIGAAIAPRDGDNLKSLSQVADNALYESKEARGGAGSDSTLVLTAVADEPRGEISTEADRVETRIGSRAPRFIAKRPTYAVLAAAAWIAAATIGLASLLMPDAQHSNSTTAILALCSGYAIAVMAFFASPPTSRFGFARNETLALVWIGLVAYLTGGAYSPLWPLVMLYIAFDAWVLDARRLGRRLPGAIAVVLAPLAYTELGSISIPTAAALYAGVLGLVGETLVLWFLQDNREKAERLSHKLVTTDARTGLLNRREFDRRVAKAFEMETDELAVAMIDLDHFKDVNTQHGHAAGDELLVRIAKALSRCTRDEDSLARIGGDEFAVVLVNVSPVMADELAERYVRAIDEAVMSNPLPACRAVSATSGIAMLGPDGRTLDELLMAADRKLMSAKSDRDRASVGSSITATG